MERETEREERESKREPITRILIIGHISNAYKFRTNFKPLIEYANDDDRQQHTYTHYPSKPSQIICIPPHSQLTRQQNASMYYA